MLPGCFKTKDVWYSSARNRFSTRPCQKGVKYVLCSNRRSENTSRHCCLICFFASTNNCIGQTFWLTYIKETIQYGIFHQTDYPCCHNENNKLTLVKQRSTLYSALFEMILHFCIYLQFCLAFIRPGDVKKNVSSLAHSSVSPPQSFSLVLSTHQPMITQQQQTSPNTVTGSSTNSGTWFRQQALCVSFTHQQS